MEFRQLFKRDGWQNVLSGFGVLGKDKRLSATYQTESYTQEELQEIWRGDDIAARIIETLPREMLREGFEVCVENDPKSSRAVDQFLEDLDVVETLRKFFEFERSYGGAVVILGADDGARNWESPLNEESLKSFRWMRVLCPDELKPVTWDNDFRSNSYGEPLVWQIVPKNTPPNADLSQYPFIHSSRIIRVNGIQTGNRKPNTTNWWGDSVLQRCMQTIKDFQAAWAGAFTLTQDFAVPVYAIKGLRQLIASNDVDALKTRLAAMETARSIINALLIDADGESVERKATPLSGLADLLDQGMYRLSLAADMPVSLLMGRAPAGLNATGESDIQQFYDRVSSVQMQKLLPILKKIVRLMMLAKEGPTKGNLPEQWGVEFFPLWQTSEKEQAEIRKIQSETDANYVNAMVLAPEEVRKSRFGGAKYSTVTQLDDTSYSEMAEAEREVANAELEATKAKATPKVAASAAPENDPA